MLSHLFHNQDLSHFSLQTELCRLAAEDLPLNEVDVQRRSFHSFPFLAEL